MDYPFLSKIMDLLLDTIFVVDAEGRYVFISASCERLLGYTPDELIGRNMIELVLPEDRERTLQAAEEIMSGQPKVHFENRYLRKDGRVVDVMWSARWSAADGIRLAVARDVTELKRAERLRTALYQISESAHAADGLPDLCRHIHQVITDLLPARNFCVALYDAGEDMISYPYYIDERRPVPQPHRPEAGTPLAQVIRTGEAQLSGTGECAQGRADWLGVPLVLQGAVVGALVMQTYSPDLCYTEDDRDLLQFISTQIATVIERKQAEAQLRHLAQHDALTGLPNRRLFEDRFDTALRRAAREHEQVALLYLDLDGFKYVNDTLGHGAGDVLLRDVAQRIEGCVRASDTVGRLGGDEFAVLVTRVGGRSAVDVVTETIRATLAAPFEVNGTSVTISAAIGMAVYPEHGKDMSELLRRADADMYAGKRAGAGQK